MAIFILILILLLGGAIAYIYVASERLNKEIASAREEAAQMRAVAAKHQKLWMKYKPIADIEAAVEEQRQIARQVIAEATAEKNAARAEKAKWEAAEKAIRNKVRGYGNRYLIPGLSVLDDLAEGWGHKEAGQKLKEVRASAKQMVIENAAADCDYADAARKETAINFVIDAFNGRVDALMARVRHDNFGTLSQQIRDVYAIVNQHGMAFRNARITPEYLLVRLEELRWAVAVFELKEQEKEEQAQIRAAMREEEKARREFEKAQKEAEKQERELHRRMKEAEQKLKLSQVEADREKLLAEIAGLQVSLQEAEEKGQRAMSMAQQTKRGHVYVISNIGSFGDDVFKIGLTRRLEPLDRVRELGDASVPFSFDVHAVVFAEDAPALETELHRHFRDSQVNKCNPRKEFFRTSLKEIRDIIESRGMQAEWTMTAEAREYKETMAIEAAGGTGKELDESAVNEEELVGVE